jgi:hypothetical protein
MDELDPGIHQDFNAGLRPRDLERWVLAHEELETLSRPTWARDYPALMQRRDN